MYIVLLLAARFDCFPHTYVMYTLDDYRVRMNENVKKHIYSTAEC